MDYEPELLRDIHTKAVLLNSGINKGRFSQVKYLNKSEGLRFINTPHFCLLLKNNLIVIIFYDGTNFLL